MREKIKEIKAIVNVLKRKTKSKNLLDIADYITDYYFSSNFDVEHIDIKLLEEMGYLFMLDILDYLLHPYKIDKKTLKETIENIDRELKSYKKYRFNKWLVNNAPVTKKQIKEKKRMLRL